MTSLTTTGPNEVKNQRRHGGHNSLRDIHSHFGNPNYHRLRIGIEHPGNAKQVADYVLKAPGADDRAAVCAIDVAVDALPLILNGQFSLATNQINGHKP